MTRDRPRFGYDTLMRTLHIDWGTMVLYFRSYFGLYLGRSLVVVLVNKIFVAMFAHECVNLQQQNALCFEFNKSYTVMVMKEDFV